MCHYRAAHTHQRHTLRLLHTITKTVNEPVIGVSGAMATHVGEMYVSAVSPTGQVATINLSDVRVVPSCPIALLGNHARQANVFYESDRHTQKLDFNGISVPVRYTDNLLVEADVVIHSESPAPLPNLSKSPMVDAFNLHFTTPGSEQNITVCDYFGGIGCMT